MAWWTERGTPWVYLRGHLFGLRVRFKLPPDAWWRWRYCSRGTCAYGNLWCPNGCPEAVLPDDCATSEASRS